MICKVLGFDTKAELLLDFSRILLDFAPVSSPHPCLQTFPPGKIMLDMVEVDFFKIWEIIYSKEIKLKQFVQTFIEPLVEFSSSSS